MMDWHWDWDGLGLLGLDDPQAFDFIPAGSVWTAASDLTDSGPDRAVPEPEAPTAGPGFGDGEAGRRPSAQSAKGVILWFDEADAIFGRREDVQDASERFFGRKTSRDDET